jgi:glycosyltransferase involved in cell wall biosynthesis
VWVGGVPLEETVHFYRSADVFVYPSFNETFGLPILEAMASACPVVTSDTSAMPETAGGAALLADPRDPESLADAIVRACDSEEERLRAAGPKRAAQFTWAVTAERTLDVYREVHAGSLAGSDGR